MSKVEDYDEVVDAGVDAGVSVGATTTTDPALLDDGADTPPVGVDDVGDNAADDDANVNNANSAPDLNRPKIPLSELTPAQREEYYLSNFGHIMFSKVIVDRIIEEIKLLAGAGVSANTNASTTAIELASSLYKFKYSGSTNINMPDVAITGDDGATITNISLRFTLALMPADYELNFNSPAKYQKEINKSIAFLKHGVAEFSKHFLRANSAVMDEIHGLVGLKFGDLVYDKKTIGQYYNTNLGSQIHVSHDYYSTTPNDATDVATNVAPNTNTVGTDGNTNDNTNDSNSRGDMGVGNSD